jgi:hypothetical protein
MNDHADRPLRITAYLPPFLPPLVAAAALAGAALALLVVADLAWTDLPFEIFLAFVDLALEPLAFALVDAAFTFEAPVLALERVALDFEGVTLPLDLVPVDLALLILLTDLALPLVEVLTFELALALVPALPFVVALPLAALFPTFLPLVVFALPFAEMPLPLAEAPFFEPALLFGSLLWVALDLERDFALDFEAVLLMRVLDFPIALELDTPDLELVFRPLVETPLPLALEDARPLALTLVLEPDLTATFFEPDLDFRPFMLLAKALGLEEPLVILPCLDFETNLELVLEAVSFIFVLALAYEEPRPLPLGRSLIPLAARLIDLSLLVAPAAFFRDPSFALSDPHTLATLARIPPLTGSCETCGFCEGWGFMGPGGRILTS